MRVIKKTITFILVFVYIFTFSVNVYGEGSLDGHTHAYREYVLTEATHTQNGLVRYECDCGHVYEEIIFSKGHNYKVEIITDLTHESNGLVRYECDCGYVYEEVIFSTGHNYKAETIIEMTHEKNGLIRYKCDCGSVYEEIIFATGHEYVPVVLTELTHTQDGVTRYKCSCGLFYDEVIKAEGHDYVTETIEPTCTDNGVVRMRCTGCNDIIVLKDPQVDPDAEELLAKGHNYIVVESSEPTQSQDGYTKYLCTVCGDRYEAILEHDDKYVVEMYICARKITSPFGHMWVYFQNKSDKTLQVGAYSLPVGQGVSVGVFGLTRSDGIGIYYNIEAYSVNRYGVDSVICMQEKLTEEELEKVSTRIARSNFWDLFIFNCMGTAFSIWNTGSNVKLIPLIFPVFGRWQIMLREHQEGIDMYYPTVNQVYKQRGNGKNATLEVVSSGSLSNGV